MAGTRTPSGKATIKIKNKAENNKDNINII